DDPAREMRDRPKEEQNGQATGDRAHEVHSPGGRMGTITEQYDKEAAQQDKKRRAGWVGDLELIAAGYELAAVPKTAGRLHGHDIDGAGDQSYDPACYRVHSIELHWYTCFFRLSAAGKGQI